MISRHDPLYATFILLGILATFKGYTTLSDPGLFLSMISVFPEVYSCTNRLNCVWQSADTEFYSRFQASDRHSAPTSTLRTFDAIIPPSMVSTGYRKCKLLLRYNLGLCYCQWLCSSRLCMGRTPDSHWSRCRAVCSDPGIKAWVVDRSLI